MDRHFFEGRKLWQRCSPFSFWISKQSMTNSFFFLLLSPGSRQKSASDSSTAAPSSCSEVSTNNKDSAHRVMISYFLLTCTPLLIRSGWQWKLILFSLSGNITMIYFRMQWRKLEDCCNMRSEINFIWCEKSWGMWGINKYEMTPSVFSSNRKGALLWRGPFVPQM